MSSHQEFSDNNPSVNANQESLSDLSASIRTFAGQCISKGSHELLTNLLYNGYNYPEGIAACEKYIKNLARFGIDLTPLFAKAHEYQKFLQSNTRSSSMQDAITTELKNDVRLIYEFVSKIKKDHEEILRSDATDDKKNSIRAIDLILNSFEYTLSFYLTREDIDCRTDIAGAVNALTPPSNSLIQLTQETLDSTEQIPDPIEEQRTKNYTSFPPHLLRMLPVYLDKIRAYYFNLLDPKKVEKGDLISALNNYNDSALSSVTGNSYFRIEHRDQDIILRWNNPILFSNAAINHQEVFLCEVLPVRKLIQELGGNLFCSIDSDEIKITINCPKQDVPDTPNMVTDPRVFHFTNGGAVISPSSASIKLSLVDDLESNPISLVIPEICIANQESRNLVSSFLSFCDKIDAGHSLSSIQLIPASCVTMGYLKYNGPFINGAANPDSEFKGALTIALEHLTYPEIANSIYKIIQEADCQSLHLSASYLDLASGFIEGIQAAISKTKQYSSGRLFVDMKALNSTNQEIAVCDTEGHLIAKGLYMTDLRRFAGRCHSPALTNRVLSVFDEIAANGEFNTLKNRKEILDKLVEELKKRKIIPKESFLELSNHFFKPTMVHTSSIAGFFAQTNNQMIELALHTMSAETIFRKFRLYLTSGIVFIEENNGVITLEGVDYDTPHRNQLLANRAIG